MGLVGYENPLYEAEASQEKSFSAEHADGCRSCGTHSAKSHSSPNSTASLQSWQHTDTADMSDAGECQPAARAQARTAAGVGSLEQLTTASSSTAATARPKKSTFWQRLTRRRPQDKKGWARLPGLKFCSTKSACHVLETGNFAEAVARARSRAGSDEPKQTDLERMPSSPSDTQSFPEAQAEDSTGATGSEPVVEGSESAVRHAAEKESAQETVLNADKAVNSHPRASSQQRIPRPSGNSVSSKCVLAALHQDVERKGQHPHSAHRRSSTLDIVCHPPKQGAPHPPKRKVSPATDRPPSRAQHSRSSSKSSHHPPALRPPSQAEDISMKSVLSSRASITELLDNWRARHPHPHPGEKPFIDPNEYGGHVNVSRISWRPSCSSVSHVLLLEAEHVSLPAPKRLPFPFGCRRFGAARDGSEATTITSVLQSKLAVHPSSQHHFKRRSAKNLPKRSVQALSVAPGGLEPLNCNLPLQLHAQQRIPPQPSHPRNWAEDNFAQAIGIQRMDKHTGLPRPKCDDWIHEAVSPAPPKCIPLEHAIGLDDSCTMSESAVSAIGMDLLAETISEAKVASFLASIPTLTLESGSMFLTATEKQGELRQEQ